MTNERVRRWEGWSEGPLAGAALLFLAAYAWPILDPGLSPSWVGACEAVVAVVWVLFALDYLARLLLADHRRLFVRANVLDLVVIVAPLLRPLRLLRLVTLLSVLNRYAATSLRGRVAVYVAGATVLVLFVAALAALDAERGAPEATIDTFGDALWFAATTVTTVGYGDTFPVTAMGRSVAVALMLAGVALLGIVTASLASWLLDRVREVEQEGRAATRRDVAELTAELTAEVASLRRQLTADAAHPPEGEPGRGVGGST